MPKVGGAPRTSLTSSLILAMPYLDISYIHMLCQGLKITCRVTSQDFLYTPSTPEAPKPSTRFCVSLNGTTSGASKVSPYSPHQLQRTVDQTASASIYSQHTVAKDTSQLLT